MCVCVCASVCDAALHRFSRSALQTLQLTATHGSTLQHTAVPYGTLQHTTPPCNTHCTNLASHLCSKQYTHTHTHTHTHTRKSPNCHVLFCKRVLFAEKPYFCISSQVICSVDAKEPHLCKVRLLVKKKLPT